MRARVRIRGRYTDKETYVIAMCHSHALILPLRGVLVCVRVCVCNYLLLVLSVVELSRRIVSIRFNFAALERLSTFLLSICTPI